MKTFLNTLSVVFIVLLLTSASYNENKSPVAVRSTTIHLSMVDQYVKNSLKEGYVVKEITAIGSTNTTILIITEKY